MDDPRNTDNAWMETVAVNFHDDTGEIFSEFKLQVSKKKKINLLTSSIVYAIDQNKICIIYEYGWGRKQNLKIRSREEFCKWEVLENTTQWKAIWDTA